jgi:ribosomal-protein-alanine N-acetyltransferase
MAFLMGDGTPNRARIIPSGPILLRPPEARDYAAWSALRGQSYDFLQPWEPTWAEDELSRNSWRGKLRRYLEDARDGRSYAFLIFRIDDEELVGGITLSRVHRGAAHMGSVGYWIGAPHVRRGYATAALRGLIRHAFDPLGLGLHRLEAACIPENEPSRRALERVGFEIEGRAKSYLRINGAWRDHLLFGLLNGDGAG